VWRGEGIYDACRRQATRTTKNDGSVTVAFGELKRENQSWLPWFLGYEREISRGRYINANWQHPTSSSKFSETLSVE
jgi:hypothetical protein